MIVERREEKKCNICRKTVAIKRGLFFRTVETYTTIVMDFDAITGNDQFEKHFCGECWNRLEQLAERELKRNEKL